MPSALVIAPHPDDEVLGCGGTILKLAAQGWAVDVVWCTNTNEFDPEAVTDTLGLRSYHGFIAPDHSLERIDLVGALAEHLTEPYDRVYLPYRHDPIADHRAAFHAAWAVVKRWRGEILEYEVPSQTEHAPVPFAPNVIEDIDADEKARAFVALYPGERTDDRNAHSIAVLAAMRGMGHHAEAFHLVRCRR